MKMRGNVDIQRQARNLAGGILLAVPAYTSAVTDADLDAIRDQMQQDWFYTEVIIFQRPAIMEFLSEEALVSQGAEGFPSMLQTFLPGPDGPQRAYRLEPSDGCQAFERSDQDVREQRFADASAGEDQAIDARAQPVRKPETADLLPVPPASPRLGPDPVVDFLRSVAEFEAQLAAQNPALFTPDRMTMNQEAARIQSDRRYQVLWHGGWLQPVPPRNAPAPLLVQTGLPSGEVFQLEGSIDVTLGRYLHFHTRLFYTEPLLGSVPVQAPLTPAAGSPAELAGAYAGRTQSDMMSALSPVQPPYMVMEESRRVRSGELHYLDHPKLGVLVRIAPVVIPDALTSAYLALEEDSE